MQYLVDATVEMNCEIIVVNDSKEHPVHFDNQYTNVKILQNPKSGAASARNYGFQNSSGEVLLFLDDDMLVSKKVLNKMYDCVTTSDKTIFLPNWIYPSNILESITKDKFGRFLQRIKYTSLEGWAGKGEEWTEEKIENQGLASYCLMISRKDFIEVNGYDENFSLAGFEDHDLSERLKKNGFRFYIMTKLIIYHNECDRLDLKSWLARRRRDAKTRREAVGIGYNELVIKNKLSNWSYPGVLIIMAFLLEKLSSLVPNTQLFDSLYFRLVNTLVAINIYLGYNNDYHK